MRAFLIISIFILSYPVIGQFQTATLQFGESLPQANLINPAIAPNYKVVIGLPGISSTYVDLNLPLSFQDLWKDDGTRFVLNEDGVLDNLSKTLRAEAITDIQLLYLGIRVKTGFISLSVRNRLENKVFIPSDLAKWAVVGPADSRVGNTLLLDDISAIGLNYMEYGLSYTQPLSTTIRLGGRVKYLSGILGLEGSQEGYVYINSDSASIQVSNLSYQVAGGNNIDNANASNFFGFGNSGFGLDVGIDAEINTDVHVSASITDIGFINWKNDIDKYESQDASYSFSGFDLTDLFFGNTPDLESELDSIATRLEPQKVAGTSFRTGLNPKINLSASYRIAEVSSVGLTLFSALDKGNIDPIVSVSHTLNIRNYFQLLTGITYKSGSINNISGGIILRPGPVQFYFITDRLNSFFYPARASSLNLRFGMNIVIGRPSLLSN